MYDLCQCLVFQEFDLKKNQDKVIAEKLGIMTLIWLLFVNLSEI